MDRFDPREHRRRPSPHHDGPYVRLSRRRVLLFLRTFVLVALILATATALAVRIKYVNDQQTKLLPPDLAQLRLRGHSGVVAPKAPEHPIRYNNGSHIDNRYIFIEHLGAGQQGTANKCLDTLTGETVVVKTFYDGNAHDTIPEELFSYFAPITHTWPAAIEAGLLLTSYSAIGQGLMVRYMPLTDYFVLQALSGLPSESSWGWAMVTPFASEGTLTTYAAALRRHNQTLPQLDAAHRPQLDALLETLVELHSAGYCHDDIKPDNIFITQQTSDTASAAKKYWILGDVDNVRQIHHPWHQTYNWRRQGQWQDCRANDVRRLLKSYLAFLRVACGDQASFDLAFVNKQQNWAILHSKFMSMAGISAGKQGSVAEQTLALSKELRPANLEYVPVQHALRYARWMRKSVAKELTCTTKSRWMDWQEDT